MQTDPTAADTDTAPEAIFGDSAQVAGESAASEDATGDAGAAVGDASPVVETPPAPVKSPKAPKATAKAVPANNAISRVLASLTKDAKELESALADAATAAEALRLENAELTSQVEELAGVSSAKIEAALIFADASDIRAELRSGSSARAVPWMEARGWFVAESLPGIGARWSKDVQKFGTSDFAHAVELEFTAAIEAYRAAK